MLSGLEVLQRPNRPDVILTAIQKYFINFDEKRDQILEAIQARHAQDLIEATHFLKSGSASLGALALAELCGVLEGLGREGDLAAAEGRAEEFAGVSDQTKSALKDLMEQKVNVTN